jgi:hypothetical protein
MCVSWRRRNWCLVTGAGYEINAKQQMDRLDEDFRNERITRREYEEKDRSKPDQ